MTPISLLLLISLFSPLLLAAPTYIDASITLSGLLDNTTSFQYIVVGGGNTGLPLAAKLAKSGKGRVLLLEAGGISVGDPRVTIPGFAGAAMHSSIYYDLYTVPQIYADSQRASWPRGKGLGGSTLLNFMAYTRGMKLEYDLWSSILGNVGWSWSSLLPYFKASESFTAPSGNSEGETVAYSASSHGTTGPIKESYPSYLSPQFVGVVDALKQRGVPVATDQASGTINGVSYVSSTIDPDSHTRETSESYLDGVPPETLTVVTNAVVDKILWSPTKVSGNVVATGVAFVVAGSTAPSLQISASKAVILSAGTVHTPGILERSGVGKPSVMNPRGISTVVNLPTVGENLQDHPSVVLAFKLKAGEISLDDVQHNPVFFATALADYATGQGILTQAIYPLAYLSPTMLLNSTDATATLTAIKATPSNLGVTVKQIAALVASFTGGSPLIELVPINAYFGTGEQNDGVSSYLSIGVSLQHQISRGNIHITSLDPNAAPSIDPKYLQAPLDGFILSRASQYVRSLATLAPLVQYIDSEIEPGPSVQTQDQWNNWINGAVRTEYHPVGTAAMLPRAEGGVVCNKMLVYGTTNVRVVDLSIVPLHISTHPQSLAYALAERAAVEIP